jgi:hypothetical protein
VVLREHRFIELFARDDTAMTAPLEHVEEDVVGERVELLDLLALHVRFARVAQEIREARRADSRVDDADRERDVVQKRRELARRPRRRVHPVKNVLAEGRSHDRGAKRRNAGVLGHGVPVFPDARVGGKGIARFR